MEIKELLNDPQVLPLLIAALLVVVVSLISFLSVKKSRSLKNKSEAENSLLKSSNSQLRQEIRQRIKDHVSFISRIILLNPVIPGNTPDDTSLEGRNRTKCLDLIVEGLPIDDKAHGVRMAEFLHQLCDYLLKAYGKEEVVTIKIDVHPVILDVESAVSVSLILNELISNAIQYGPEPGQKCKVNVFFKEREDKLVINVADNGVGMKVPYLTKYSYGLQLASTLVKLHKGDLIISSRPGTRVEVLLSDYKTAIREVYVTPTRRLH